MKNDYILIFTLLSVLCNCEKGQNNFQETILGDWDIKGGGTLYIESNSFSVSIGCNTIFGKITIIDNNLAFSLIASTLIGCSVSEVKREEELVKLLENKILNFSIENDTAILSNENDDDVLILTRPVNVTLVNSWDMISLRTQNAISYSTLDNNSGITFFDDGTIRVKTSCNGGVGGYKTKNNTLSFIDLFFTEKACDTERSSREREFSEALNIVNKYTILRNKLELKRGDEAWIIFEKR